MDYNRTYEIIRDEIVNLEGKFTFSKAAEIAFNYCPENWTKARILQLTHRIINECLNRGIIEIDHRFIYESRYAKRASRDFDTVNYCN